MKTPRSSAIKAPTMKQEEAQNLAKEMTKNCIHEVKAPKIEPAQAPGNYEVYAGYIQAHIDKHDTYTESVETLKNLFPQCKKVYHAVANLKRIYGINYKYSDLGEYVFFDGETKDETIDRLGKEMEELITEKNKIVTENYGLIQSVKKIKEEYQAELITITNENTQLKSELSNTKTQRNVATCLALALIIAIIILLTN